ncbi:MAG: ankyrin repeat domain-containing protein [Betaproteobacteria bacterium]|nr:ankyrin repeat domain-containing protein [Betaproteobacteria bacterium]
MDSAPVEVREFLKYRNITDVRSIIGDAASNNRVDVLEWLHESTPGGITAEDCRYNNNYALQWAARAGHMDVLEWLNERIGGVTAEDCRSYNNCALRWAASYGRVAALDWLHQHIPGGVTAEDCRIYDNCALRWAARAGHVPVLEWLATKLTLAEFVKCKCGGVWLQMRKKSMLALVVAGKRRKIRLPPELWELVWGLVEQWY